MSSFLSIVGQWGACAASTRRRLRSGGTAASTFDITRDDLTSVTMTAQRVAQHARAELNVEGVNVLNCSGAVAWQSVLHFHLHLIPRYSAKDKDGLTVPWQPGVPGDADAIAGIGGRLSVARRLV